VTYAVPYRDPFVLFTHLAATTRSIHFRTAILILPLYPTALVARQAADLSLISGGRFELGVSVSWNEAEYAALGQDVHTRGRRLEEQLTVLRLFWSEPLVTFHGAFHSIDALGLGELPAHPIPIWVGHFPQAPLLRRVARLGDGWLPIVDPSPHIEELRGYVREAGRDPDTFGIAARLDTTAGGPEDWVAEVERFRAAGATEITLNPPAGANATDGVTAMIATKDAIASATT
jgi:probable F420-dependent oxidoreductase